MNWQETIGRRYGRKQALLRHMWFWWQDRLGFFGRYCAVDWRSVHRLIFVCQGNICRSPYAEAKARSMGLRSASFGLRAGRGIPAHGTVSRLAGCAGLDLSGHGSHVRTEIEFAAHDLLIGLEPWHGKELELLCRSSGARVTLLGLWCTDRRPHVEDPYGLPEAYFRTCLELIDNAIGNIARLCRQHQSPAIENGQPASPAT